MSYLLTAIRLIKNTKSCGHHARSRRAKIDDEALDRNFDITIHTDQSLRSCPVIACVRLTSIRHDMTTKKEVERRKMKFAGTWHIQDMDMWDEDYLNMEVQAYIKIESNNLGTFQFGLVSGQLDGEVSEIDGQEIFYFSWEGNDENDPASGGGWCKLKDNDTLEGRIKLHLGDSSGFRAVRA